MKKHLFVALAGLTVLAACQKEQAPAIEEEVLSASPVAKVTRFFATAESQASTKVVLEGQEDGSFASVWDGAESIWVYNGVEHAGYQLSEDGESSIFADFVPLEEAIEETGQYVTWTPSYLPFGRDEEFYGDRPFVFLPSEQVYFEDVPFVDVPLLAVSNSQELSFKHLGGFIRFNLKAASGSEDFQITNINVFSSTQISGPFSFDVSDGTSLGAVESLAPGIESFSDGTYSDSGLITLYVEPVDGQYPTLSTTETTPFLISIPAGDYGGYFRITVTGLDGNGREVSQQFLAKKTISVERAKITDITLTVNLPTVNQAYLQRGPLFRGSSAYPGRSWGDIAGDSNNIKKVVFETGSSTTSGVDVSYEGEDVTSDAPVYARYSNGIVTISTAADIIYVKDATSLFENLYKLEAVEGLENLNTSKTTEMGSMFSKCYALTSIDLTALSVDFVRTFNMMFYECSALNSVNLSTWKTRALTSAYHMFSNCRNIATLNLGPDFTMSSVTEKRGMCLSLGEDLKSCTITCTSATKDALLETDPNYPNYATTRLGNEKNVTINWVIVK